MDTKSQEFANSRYFLRGATIMQRNLVTKLSIVYFLHNAFSSFTNK